MLTESEDLPLRDTTRLASYKRLGCKSEAKDDTPYVSIHTRLLY